MDVGLIALGRVVDWLGLTAKELHRGREVLKLQEMEDA